MPVFIWLLVNCCRRRRETGFADKSIPGSDEDFLAFVDELRRSGRRAPTLR